VAGSAPARRPLLSFTGFFLFVLALFAKTTAVVVPAVLLVLVWWKRGEIRGKDVGPLVPWFGAGLALAAHTAWLERTMVAATGKDWSLSLADRIVLAGRVFFFYSRKFFFPRDLAFFYERWTVDSRALLQWLPTLVALLALFLAWRLRERLGRGPLAALLLFGGVLFPALGSLTYTRCAIPGSWTTSRTRPSPSRRPRSPAERPRFSGRRPPPHAAPRPCSPAESSFSSESSLRARPGSTKVRKPVERHAFEEPFVFLV